MATDTLEYEDMSKAQLQAELRGRGESDKGRKAELIDRLQSSGGSEDDADRDDGGDPPRDENGRFLRREDADNGDRDAADADDDAPEAERSEEADAHGDADPDAAEDADRGATDERQSGAEEPREERVDPRTLASDGLDAMDVARIARQHLEDLTGCRVETISDLVQDEDGWFVRVEILEVEHINKVEDQLGTYDLAIDNNGRTVALKRRASYQRGLMH